MDDAAVIVIGKNFMETHEKLQNIMNRVKGIFSWAKIHNCKFSIEKFQLVNSTKKLIPHPLNPRKKIPSQRSALILESQHIPSRESTKFLGVMRQQNELERTIRHSTSKGARLVDPIQQNSLCIKRHTC